MLGQNSITKKNDEQVWKIKSERIRENKVKIVALSLTI